MDIVDIVPAGDAALVVRLPERIDPAMNAWCVAFARALEQELGAAQRDVVIGYCSVTVYFDPLRADAAWVEDRMHAIAGTVRANQHAESGVVEVPVCYGGALGPDLEDVASFGGCTSEDVIDRHMSREYRVYLVGFVPGFAYMAEVDPTIAAPRRASPRTSVPAGSVAVAGGQTGIYPAVTPGGWNIIGRTSLAPYDPSRREPFLFRPGDRVRFHRVPTLPGSDPIGSEPSGQNLMGSDPNVRIRTTGSDHAGIAIVRPGMLTSVQDLGRWGLQARGVPVAGPMDEYSHRLANRLVGNDPSAGALEITLIGPEVQAGTDVLCAVAGASFELTAGGARVPMNAPFQLRAGASLRFGDRLRGARATLAVRGGIAVDATFGSRATSLIARMGPFDGRPLRAGDVLPIGDEVSDRPAVRAIAPLSLPAGGARVRVLPGPHAEMFTPAAYETLFGGRYTITPQSNRMGYRLEGPRLAHRGPADILSDATAIGSLQVPASGQPILLMADRQTTGGYPKIATVISADLPLAGQLAPGDWIEFKPCTRSEAHAAARQRFGAFFGSFR